MNHNSSKRFAGPWKYFLVFVVFVLVFNMSCALTGSTPPTATPLPPPPTNTATPAPTSTPKPTDTPVPTNTPVPTSTPVPTATNTSTPTLDLTATAAFASTKTSEAAAADFKTQMNKIGVKVDTGHLAWSNTGSDEITLSKPDDNYYLPFAKDISVSDFILKTDVTWNATGVLICGMLFRSEPNFETGKQYEFEFLRISGLPAWVLWFVQDGRLVRNITTNTRFSDAIKLENDATNTFIIVAEGEKFTVYANSKRLGSFYDYPKSSMEGYFAYIGWQESGQSTCTYTNTTVWALK